MQHFTVFEFQIELLYVACIVLQLTEQFFALRLICNVYIWLLNVATVICCVGKQYVGNCCICMSMLYGLMALPHCFCILLMFCNISEHCADRGIWLCKVFSSRMLFFSLRLWAMLCGGTLAILTWRLLAYLDETKKVCEWTAKPLTLVVKPHPSLLCTYSQRPIIWTSGSHKIYLNYWAVQIISQRSKIQFQNNFRWLKQPEKTVVLAIWKWGQVLRCISVSPASVMLLAYGLQNVFTTLWISLLLMQSSIFMSSLSSDSCASEPRTLVPITSPVILKHKTQTSQHWGNC